MSSVSGALFALRVSVTRWSSKPWNERSGVPSGCARRAAFSVAARERLAGATGSIWVGRVSSVKVSGARTKEVPGKPPLSPGYQA